MDDFVIEEKLGSGTFSEVYRVRRKTDDNIYALKRVSMLPLNEKE